jgi:putative effector of murein hydrolase LrgA (UPF0299 family)
MNPYLKYTNLAFQLILYIFAGNYFGKWIATYFHFNPSTGSAIGILIMLGLGLYKIIRDIMKESK